MLKRTLTKRRIIILLILIGIGILGWYFLRQKNGKELEAYTVNRENVKEVLVLSGEIDAVEYAKLSFGSSGEIEWIGVKKGDEVKKGQALAKLNTISLNASYQRARADLRAAEASVAKVHDDVKDHSGDETFAQKDTRTTAEVAKDKAYEAVLIAEKALKDATLKAPFAGMITYIANPFVGVTVTAAQTQIELLNPDTVYFKVFADQTEVIGLQVGQSVDITLDAMDEKTLKGTISDISFVPDPEETNVVYEVEVTFNNFDEIINFYRIGMSGDASFLLQEAAGVIAVPATFINSDKEGKYVLTENGKKRTVVTIGLEGEEFIEVKEGLSEGQVIYD